MFNYFILASKEDDIEVKSPKKDERKEQTE